ncbi:MAG: type IV pilus biogenesis protein PilM [bacterium]
MKIFTAVEIDYNQFKILEIYKKRRGYFLNNFVNIKIPEIDYNDINSVSFNLNKIMQENKISRKNILTAINGNSVHSFNFILPDMPASDLKISVEYELKKLLPFPLSQCIFDYIYIKKIDESGNTALNITAFASKEEDISNFMKIFIMAGIKIKSIECKTVSIYNNIRYMSKNKIKHLLLCDIGETATKIIIILNDMINFERTADGIDLKNMSESNASSFASEELKRTLDFYFAGKSLPEVEGIILTGIFSGQKGFDRKISEKAGIKAYSVSIINLLESKKNPLYLSKNLIKHNIEKDYEFFKPLEEMWTTLGLIINR